MKTILYFVFLGLPYTFVNIFFCIIQGIPPLISKEFMRDPSKKLFFNRLLIKTSSKFTYVQLNDIKQNYKGNIIQATKNNSKGLLLIALI